MKKFNSGLAAVALLLAASLPAVSAPAPYKPSAKLTGLIRFSGNDNMKGIIERWQTGFRKHHPDVIFENKRLNGTGAGIYGLEVSVSEIAAMSRLIDPFELYGTYERSYFYPVEIEVASGSDIKTGKSPALAVFVHKDNPLAKMTMEQLDGVFGAERTGGWNKLSWMLDSARGTDKNIRTWGQLGVTGALAGQTIHPYGPPILGAGTISYLERKLLQGGGMWNEELREYADRKKMVTDAGNDPSAIAIAPLANANPNVKAIAIAATAGGPFVPLTKATVQDRSYPLVRPVYLDYTIDTITNELSPTRGDPKVTEFIRYTLSREGQAAVAAEGSFVPLPDSVIAEQIKKIENRVPPPERDLLEE